MKSLICLALLAIAAVIAIEPVVNARQTDEVGVRVIRRVRGGCSGGKCG